MNWMVSNPPYVYQVVVILFLYCNTGSTTTSNVMSDSMMKANGMDPKTVSEAMPMFTHLTMLLENLTVLKQKFMWIFVG